MNGRCEDESYISNKYNPAEKSVNRRKQFAFSGVYLYHRSHTAQDHGGIMQCINPGSISQVMITNDANNQAYHYNPRSNQQVFKHPLVKDPAAGQGLFFMLVHDNAIGSIKCTETVSSKTADQKVHDV